MQNSGGGGKGMDGRIWGWAQLEDWLGPSLRIYRSPANVILCYISLIEIRSSDVSRGPSLEGHRMPNPG